jgi:hypothetical protein
MHHLARTTNILRFQRRFHLVPGWNHPDNASTINFVFRRPEAELDDLPQDTSLQRAIVAHVRAGGTWNVRRGWCSLEER